MGNSRILSQLFLALIFVANTLAENLPGNADQLQDFCRRWGHRTAVVSNRLYIDGGFVNRNPLTDYPTNYTSKTAIILSMIRELTISTQLDNDMFYANLLNTTDGMPTMMTPSKKNTTVPLLAGGTLWSDNVNENFYAFGGYFSDSAPSIFDTWLYDAKEETWATVTTKGDVTYVALGMSATADDAGVAYYLGGYHDSQTQSGWLANRLYTSNLVSFDMIARSYTNSSGPDSNGRGEGLMVFIPASTSGLLIYFGGVVQDASTGEISGVGQIETFMLVKHRADVFRPL
jgi:hypothetical protein